MDRIVRNFRLLEQIGTGGMGVIYRAIQTTLDRPVALKEMHPHLAKDQEFLQRFEREAKTAATLTHENIIGVIDFGHEGECYFLALEFVDGYDLKALIAKDPKVVLPVALTVMDDVLKGLEHAHARGIVHRDIKPANVMITRDGIAKIADFSIAQAQTLPSMTATGAVMGTPAYMSPEQAAGGRPVDARSDLFSAGVILYEMLGGVRPFDGDTYPSIISRLLTVNPPELHDIDPVVPPSITRLAKRALEKDPDKRFQSAADFRRDLENAAQDEKIPLDRGLVAAWVKAPKEFQDALKRRQAQELFQRGLYLKNQGLSHLDEAIKALAGAMSLDPSNADAKKHLDELYSAKQDTLVMQRRSLLRKQQRRNWAIGLGSGIGIAALAGVVWHFAPAAGVRPTPTAPIAVGSLVPSPVSSALPSPESSPEALALSMLGTPAPTSAALPTLAAAATPRVKPTPRATATKVERTTPRASPTPTVLAIATPPPPPSATPITHATPAGTTLTVVDPEMTDTGYLKLVVKPWAKVYVDGKYVGETPFARPLKITTGKHDLRLENPNMADHEESFEIPPGSMLTRQVQLREK